MEFPTLVIIVPIMCLSCDGGYNESKNMVSLR